MRYENSAVYQDIIDPKTKASVSSGKFIGRTMLYVGAGLLLTFFIMFAIGITMKLIVGDALIAFEEFGDIDALMADPVKSGALVAYGIMLAVSAITMLVIMIVINITMFAKGKVHLVPYLIYASTMGVFLSSFALVMPFWEIAAAIGITSLVFGAMALVGFLGGDKIKWFGVVGIGLLFGSILIGLAAIPIFIFIPQIYGSSAYAIYYLIMSFVTLVAMILITAYDFWRVKKIASKGTACNDLALYCAFNLYVDFIYILIRILSILARSKK